MVTSAESSSEPAPKRVKLEFESFFDKERWTNCTISFAGITINAHKNMLARKSTWFEACFSNQYREALESAITLSEDEPNGVKAMFFFLYDQKYTHVHDNAFDDLLFHVEVYKTADKYGIPALMKVVAKELSKIVNTKWNDPLFPQAVLEGYGLPDYDGANGLCNGMQIACERNIDALRANKNFMTMLHHVPLLGARLTAFTIDQFQAYKKLSPNNNESPLFAMCPRCRSSISTRYYEHATKFNYSNTYSNYGKYFSCPAKCGFEFSEGLKTSDTAKVYM